MKNIGCPVCAQALSVSPAKSRKARNPKTFLMLLCPSDGRHFRAFVSDREFVSKALDNAASALQTGTGSVGG